MKKQGISICSRCSLVTETELIEVIKCDDFEIRFDTKKELCNECYGDIASECSTSIHEPTK